ncbi:hypothetical protein LGH70_00930 [Hymenobacter sp. BT635]|uniref:Gliding motility lipoprotein GldH n=1 Tax=Hymenobacter nitidus TaxID=2880929 RepID=A0ABS8A6V7_9BACT|nr:hypothetical protein [Hymenobacter nitidus]MCB2376128.1 hypothetical protein [Hymenobacter nitidus]
MRFLPYLGLGLLLSASSLTSCNKVDFGPAGGITEKTATDAPNGHVDSSDWTLEANWGKKEKDLFKGLQGKVNLDGTTSTYVTNLNFTFYPNPVDQFAYFGYDFDLLYQDGLMVQTDYVIVDRNNKVLQSGSVSSRTTTPDGRGFSGFSLSFLDEKFKKGKTYRMYYVLYEPTKLAFMGKGHGDIEMAD